MNALSKAQASSRRDGRAVGTCLDASAESVHSLNVIIGFECSTLMICGNVGNCTKQSRRTDDNYDISDQIEKLVYEHTVSDEQLFSFGWERGNEGDQMC
ncbi:hypothetical protein PR001_g7923 [Phytophthora rubi]|uniref:Uncharacterized protein n=1 Tax=Phytophthora rubi TaxID=129364 RepID=A0A6A3MZ86_9STRA|nr:hypothetical protein PR001_g7923 [Phytophthora rubi]